MLAKDLISEVIQPLQPSDTGAGGLLRMEAFRISHLPIVDGGNLVGIISDVDIFDHNMVDKPVGRFPHALFSPFVYEHRHLYEVIEVVLQNNLTAVPVLNEKHVYIGMIGSLQLIRAFGDMATVRIPGGIIVLELNVHDYSLSQIARIVEENDAKVLSCYAAPQPDSVKMEVTLKINRTDLTSILQTFFRYDYTVKASYQSDDRNEEVLRSNYERLMMYMNV